MVWINGHLLMRFWKIGPQRTLYVPRAWLRLGRNQIEVFDLDGGPGLTVQGLDRATLDAPIKTP